jgi:hypothetical protein
MSLLFCLGISKPLPEDRFDFTLHAGTRCYLFFHKHVLVFLFYCCQPKKKKKIGGEDA